MAWTEITCAQYRREDVEYASDLRDAERALIAPGHGGDPLYRHDRLPVATIAMLLSRLHDRAGLFLPLDPRGTMGGDQPCSRGPVA